MHQELRKQIVNGLKEAGFGSEDLVALDKLRKAIGGTAELNWFDVLDLVKWKPELLKAPSKLVEKRVTQGARKLGMDRSVFARGDLDDGAGLKGVTRMILLSRHLEKTCWNATLAPAEYRDKPKCVLGIGATAGSYDRT